MVNLAQILISTSAGIVAEDVIRGSGESKQNGSESPPTNSEGNTPRRDGTQQQANEGVVRELEELNRRERRNEPTYDSIDAWVGTTVNNLSAGGTATITITPTNGHELYVKRLEFTRQDNHIYTMEIGGVTVETDFHKWKATTPRRVNRGQPIVARVENNTDQSNVSNKTTDIDFEFEGWGRPTNQGRVR